MVALFLALLTSLALGSCSRDDFLFHGPYVGEISVGKDELNLGAFTLPPHGQYSSSITIQRAPWQRNPRGHLTVHTPEEDLQVSFPLPLLPSSEKVGEFFLPKKRAPWPYDFQGQIQALRSQTSSRPKTSQELHLCNLLQQWCELEIQECNASPLCDRPPPNCDFDCEAPVEETRTTWQFEAQFVGPWDLSTYYGQLFGQHTVCFYQQKAKQGPVTRPCAPETSSPSP